MSNDVDREELRLALIAQITAAFEDVTREDGVTLHEAEVIDHYGTDAQRAAARLLDSDTRWLDVQMPKSQRILPLYFLDSKGFRYYLPAYMIWALKYSNTSFIDIFDVPTSQAEHAPRMARFELLTPEQTAAVCCFLHFTMEYSADYYDSGRAKDALSRYWGQFCEV